MLFSEIYSAYYNTVAAILSAAVDRQITWSDILELTRKNAFAESAMTIEPALKNEKWQLLTKELATPIQHRPTMPLTDLQRQWLKAVSLDPRIKLFDISFELPGDVEPLFTPEDYVIYDKYSDGDDYTDEEYINRFRMILQAVRSYTPLEIEMRSARDRDIRVRVFPERLEYSEKDDKFRLFTSGCRSCGVINLSRITSCRPCHGNWSAKSTSKRDDKYYVTLEITDGRNTLERVMLHFAHFEKQAEQLDQLHYRVTVYYDVSDETEMLIRVLSFGPFVRVTEPQRFIGLMTDRLRRQQSLLKKE